MRIVEVADLIVNNGAMESIRPTVIGRFVRSAPHATRFRAASVRVICLLMIFDDRVSQASIPSFIIVNFRLTFSLCGKAVGSPGENQVADMQYDLTLWSPIDYAERPRKRGCEVVWGVEKTRRDAGLTPDFHIIAEGQLSCS